MKNTCMAANVLRKMFSSFFSQCGAINSTDGIESGFFEKFACAEVPWIILVLFFLSRTSTRPDLIAITPLYENPIDPECTSKAVVTTRSRERRRHTAVVLAEDLSTGEILRCDVIVDIIDQLGVLTTTRELYLEEAPETFELWAQDSQGKHYTCNFNTNSALCTRFEMCMFS